MQNNFRILVKHLKVFVILFLLLVPVWYTVEARWGQRWTTADPKCRKGCRVVNDEGGDVIAGQKIYTYPCGNNICAGNGSPQNSSWQQYGFLPIDGSTINLLKDAGGKLYYVGDKGQLVEVGDNPSNIPPLTKVTGIVWEDVDHNGARNAGDVVWGRPGNVSCAGSTSSRLNTGVKSNKFAGNIDATWDCAANNEPKYTSIIMPQGAQATVELTTPKDFHSCNFVTWTKTVCTNLACTVSNTTSGTGCVATISSLGQYQNIINWKIDLPVRSIVGKVFQTSNPAACSQTGTLPFSGLTAKAFRNTVQLGPTAQITSSNGNFSVTPLASTDQFTALTINGTLSNETQAFRLACVRATNATCTLGSGASINCPNASLTNSNVSIDLGFLAFSSEKWFTALDGDIYSEGVSTYVATTPLGGFSSNLINTETGSSVGGYGFAGSSIDTQTAGSDVSEAGGSAEMLGSLSNYPYEDEWLNRFSFSVPDGAVTDAPSGNTFTEGTVYSLTVDQFNNVLAQGSYDFEDGNSNSPAAAIVYVIGDGTIEINEAFISDNADKILVIVTSAPVEIASDVGRAVAGYSMAGASQLDLAIISSEDITINSVFDFATGTNDEAIVIGGTLISRSAVSLGRNLGYIDNASYPSEVVRFYPYLISLISKYEIENATTGPYTGLATVDVQFDYGE